MKMIFPHQLPVGTTSEAHNDGPSFIGVLFAKAVGAAELHGMNNFCRIKTFWAGVPSRIDAC